MKSPEERRINHLVGHEQLDEVRIQLGPDRTGGAGNSQGRTSVLDLVPKFEKKMEGQVEYCVLYKTVPNLTRLNQSLASSVRLDGCLPCGGVVKGDDSRERYVRVVPQGVRLTEEAINRLPDGQRSAIERVRGQIGSSDAWILVWGAPGISVKRTDYDVEKWKPKERKSLQLGNPVQKSQDDKPTIAVVVSERRRRFPDRLKVTIGKSGVIQAIVVATDTLMVPFQDRHHVQTSLATLVWIDSDIHDYHLGALTADAHHNRLFLLADESDDASVRRAQKLAECFQLPDSHLHRVNVHATGLPKQDDLQALTAQVKTVIELGRQKRGKRKESETIWNEIKKHVESVITDENIDPEIVDDAVLIPFCNRLGNLRKGIFASDANAQLDFVRVATPLYSQALEIYALHTDRYSAFWDLGDFSTEAKLRYLTNCPTVRLFLFSSPDAVRRHLETTLNFQAEHYRRAAEPGPSKAKLLVADLYNYTRAFGAGLTHLNSASTQGERGGGSRCPSRRGGVCP